MTKFSDRKRLPGARLASRAAARQAMTNPPSQRDDPDSERDHAASDLPLFEKSTRSEQSDPATIAPPPLLPATIDPPPLLRKLSSASNAAVVRVLAAVTGAGVDTPSADLVSTIVAECAAKSRDRRTAPAILAGCAAQSQDRRTTLVEAVQRQEMQRLRLEAKSLQRQLNDVEVGQLRAENSRLKAENARLHEINRDVRERARKSVEEAKRLSDAAWEMASTHVEGVASREWRSSSPATSLDESSRVSDAFAGAGELSLDARLAHADAATPPASMSLLRQMAENNRRLKEQLAM